MKPPAPGSKEAQLKALRERTPINTPTSSVAQPKESDVTKKPTKTKKRPAVKAATALKLAKTAKKTSKPKAKPAPAKPAPAAATQPAQPPSGARKQYPWADAAEKAKAGTLPLALDFTAACNAPYRERKAAMEKLAMDGDIKGLKAFEIPDYNSIVKAMRRWRDLAVTALSV